MHTQQLTTVYDYPSTCCTTMPGARHALYTRIYYIHYIHYIHFIYYIHYIHYLPHQIVVHEMHHAVRRDLCCHVQDEICSARGSDRDEDDLAHVSQIMRQIFCTNSGLVNIRTPFCFSSPPQLSSPIQLHFAVPRRAVVQPNQLSHMHIQHVPRRVAGVSPACPPRVPGVSPREPAVLTVQQAVFERLVSSMRTPHVLYT